MSAQPRDCVVCGVPFAPRNANGRFCTAWCGNRYRRPVDPELAIARKAAKKAARASWPSSQAPYVYNDAARDSYHRKRARRKQAATGRPVRRDEIGARDEWQCGICHEAVDRLLPWPDPMSPSLDHVVPLSLGGIHDPGNVVVAHLLCNIEKGAALLAS